MVFSSTVFLLVFLPIVLALYYICPSRYRNLLLLIASLIFYGWGEPKYIVVMVFSILINYISGILIDRFRRNDKHRLIKPMLIVAIIGNVGILGFFKYTDFLIENINSIAMTSMDMLELALPIGISFYTFQAMSYVIDVYRGKVEVQKSIIKFGTYITLFPQLIAGPIVRYITIEKQLTDRKVDIDQIATGVRRFILGLGKKVLLANQIGILWEQASDMAEVGSLSPSMAWLGALVFTFQIYFDFSGYSDMAIGLGKMLGFDFDENFNYPYMSRSITEFWRRWHISLSTWFKEYVYIPLGGNRKGLLRQVINIAIVWGLTGFWHGASWNFLLWGLYYGFILILEKLFLLNWLDKLPSLVRRIYSLFIIVMGWVIFAVTDMSQMGVYFKSLFGMGELGMAGTMAGTSYAIMGNAVLLIILILASTDIPKSIGTTIMTKLESKETLALIIKNLFYGVVLLLCIAFLVSDSYNPFLYFRF